MTKQQLLELFIGQLSLELESLTAAAKNTIATATDGEHVARSKYETFGLESSYLARGQAKRVEELGIGLEQLKSMDLPESMSAIQWGALVRLQQVDGEERQTLFLVPAAGGEEMIVDEELITLVTPVSPLGKAVLGKQVGERFEIGRDFDARRFEIVSVS